MATYEFKCATCGERFPVTAAMSEHDQLRDHPPACPKCQSHETHQVVSLFTSKPASTY